MGLPVLRLPSLVFGNVYRFLDVPEVILLSQCSRSMKAIVKERSSQNSYFLIVNVETGSAYVRLGEMRNGIPCNDFYWDLKADETWPLDDKEVISNDVIGGITKRKSANNWISWVKEEFFIEKLLAICKKLKETFKCSSIRSVFYCANNRTHFRKLFMETDMLHCANEMQIENAPFEPEEIDFMLDNFKTNALDFHVDCPPGYSYQKPLNYSEALHIKFARWIPVEMLLQMVKTTAIIGLEAANLIPDKDINQFIKSWLISDNQKLEILVIGREQNAIDIDETMEGIESTRARKKREEAMPTRLQHLAHVNGLDIRREDGTYATVFLEDSCFVLGVMQQPNPFLE